MQTPLDFELAYVRVRDELVSQPKTFRALVVDPWEIDLVEVDRTGWLSDLRARVEAGEYVPGVVEVCDAPKGGGLVRPATRLRLADRVVYTAAVGACLPAIDRATRWSQGACDFAPRLDPSALDKREWLRSPFLGWKEFRTRSLQRLDSPTFAVVLSADIAGYFENVSLPLLASDLRRVGSPEDAISLISGCLNNWAVALDRGLPQGIMASDILAKLYLESVDRRLRSEGFVHLRYVDDFRVFASDEHSAQRCLVTLTRALRERGLTLQSAKTVIRPKEDVREEIEGAVPAVQGIQKQYVEKLRVAGLMAADVSLPMSAIDDLAGTEGDVVDRAVLYAAFDRFVVQERQPNRTMFNYLMARFGALGDVYAVEHVLPMLGTTPERTPVILRYLERLPDPGLYEAALVDVLASESSAIFPYQRYLILRWMTQHLTRVSEDSLRVLRPLAFHGASSQFVQAYARQLLGSFGDQSDLERLIELLRSTPDELERAQLLCGLGRLEKGRRNALIGRVRRAGSWAERAAVVATTRPAPSRQRSLAPTARPLLWP